MVIWIILENGLEQKALYIEGALTHRIGLETNHGKEEKIKPVETRIEDN